MSWKKNRKIPVFETHEKFLCRISVDANSGCWNWIGGELVDGYGAFFINKENSRFLAHRVSYDLFVGDLKNGMVLDHVCRNRKCVNPDHLQQVTNKENIARSATQKSGFCKNGHALTPDNVEKRKDATSLRCIVCRKIGQIKNKDKWNKMRKERWRLKNENNRSKNK